MAGFIRRFLTDPGQTVLLEIESVNILDLEPPAGITGVGSGTVLVVGEFEDGPFATPLEVTSVTDLVQAWDGDSTSPGFGQLGYLNASVPSNNPSARSRNADGAGVEFWNGNGFLALSGKKFRRLIVCRVDTRVGAVEFRRLACILGNNRLTWDLEPAQTLSVTTNLGGPFIVTFSATAATVLGVGGTFVGITAGETVTLGDTEAADIVVTFLTGDTTVAAVVARINTFFGYTFATVDTGQIRLTSRRRGTASQVRVVAGTAGTLVDLGLTVANTSGTGNVANIDAVTLSELDTLVSAASATTVRADRNPDGRVRLCNVVTPATGTLIVNITTTADNFEFTEGVTVNAAAAANTGGTIPAGTRVSNGVTTYVTMQTITVPNGALGAGPFTTPVRPALDDGTGLGAIAGAVTTVSDSLFDGFSVVNPLALTAALTEAAIDAVYLTALNATLNLNSVARETNIVYAARQSNNLRRFLRDNARDASAIGMFGRMAMIRPPQGITTTAARSSSEPGVGAYRDQRVVYTYPQWRTFVPQIAARGATAGGAGFTDDGVINLGADGFLASVLSQLAPEENPGQLTTFLGAVVGLESGAPANLTITDYTNFRSSGICAPRIDEGSPIYQSGVTSVDPSVSPNLRNIARRRMADFIQDSLARRTTSFSKKLNTPTRRNALVAEYNAFLAGLLSVNNPANQRIDGYILDQKNGNTPATLAAGMFRVIVRVRTLSSLDSIVIQTEIGESVEVSELAA